MATHDLEETFLAFREQCIWLQTCFNIYTALFEADEKTTTVLASTAPLFFHDLNLILVEYCLLQVCRLTDPPKSSKKDNLTVRHINFLLQNEGLLTSEISGATNGLAHYRSLIIDSRNWIISHADKRTLLNDLPIGEHTKADASAFFESLYQYVDSVGTAIGVGPLDFRTTSGSGDALDLIRQLTRA